MAMHQESLLAIRLSRSGTSSLWGMTAYQSMTFTLGNGRRFVTTPVFHTAPEQDYLMLPDKLLYAAHIYLSIPNQADSMLKSLPGFNEVKRFSVCTASPNSSHTQGSTWF